MKQPSSNISFLRKAFKDIIQSVKDTDQSGKRSNKLTTRATFCLIDGSFLSITEIMKGGYVDYFHYDWLDKNKQMKYKFHSEPHEDGLLQTVTEPFHIHIPDRSGLSKEKRLPNEKHRDLITILEMIRISII